MEKDSVYGVFFPPREAIVLPPEEDALQYAVSELTRALHAIRQADARSTEALVLRAGYEPEQLYRNAMILHGRVVRADLLPSSTIATPVETVLHKALVDQRGLRVSAFSDAAVADADKRAMAWNEFLSAECVLRMPPDAWGSAAAFVQMTYCVDRGLRRMAEQMLDRTPRIAELLTGQANLVTSYVDAHADHVVPELADVLRGRAPVDKRSAKAIALLMNESIAVWPPPSTRLPSRGEVPSPEDFVTQEEEEEEEDDAMQLGRRAADYESDS